MILFRRAGESKFLKQRSHQVEPSLETYFSLSELTLTSNFSRLAMWTANYELPDRKRMYWKIRDICSNVTWTRSSTAIWFIIVNFNGSLHYRLIMSEHCIARQMELWAFLSPHPVFIWIEIGNLTEVLHCALLFENMMQCDFEKWFLDLDLYSSAVHCHSVSKLNSRSP